MKVKRCFSQVITTLVCCMLYNCHHFIRLHCRYIYDYCRRLWAVGESVEVKDKDDDDGWSPGVIEEVDYFGTPKVHISF